MQDLGEAHDRGLFFLSKMKAKKTLSWSLLVTHVCNPQILADVRVESGDQEFQASLAYLVETLLKINK